MSIKLYCPKCGNNNTRPSFYVVDNLYCYTCGYEWQDTTFLLYKPTLWGRLKYFILLKILKLWKK
jgi:hypothetical protein